MTLQFPLTGALTVPFTIAAGTLVGTNDGQFAFATIATISIPAGEPSPVSPPPRPLQERVRMDTWRGRSPSS